MVSACPSGFSPSLPVWPHRRDLRGYPLAVVYDEWVPFCKMDEQGTGLQGGIYKVLERLFGLNSAEN